MIKFSYVIKGKITRGGSLFAENFVAARKEVEALLQSEETIFTLYIDRR